MSRHPKRALVSARKAAEVSVTWVANKLEKGSGSFANFRKNAPSQPRAAIEQQKQPGHDM